PGLDMGPLFTAIAISERGSEKYHVDWLDHKRIPAVVISLGDFETGRVCLSQLEQKYMLQSGDGCTMAARLLAHCAQVLGGGHRDVLTLFTHNSLV
ncbi:hypothetical protein K474DRAFT_1567809, partial [Panus rudis PR-1116 ss-1]